MTIVDFDIEQVRLRQRLRRLVEAIGSLETMASTEESAVVVRSIVVDNLRDRIRSFDPLGHAIDFLPLARDLISKRNLLLAAVCLQKAEAALKCP